MYEAMKPLGNNPLWEIMTSVKVVKRRCEQKLEINFFALGMHSNSIAVLTLVIDHVDLRRNSRVNLNPLISR